MIHDLLLKNQQNFIIFFFSFSREGESGLPQFLREEKYRGLNERMNRKEKREKFQDDISKRGREDSGRWKLEYHD